MSTKKKSPVTKPESTTKPKAAVTPKKTYTAEQLLAECKKQDIYPSLSSGNFDGYFSRDTSKKVTTALPDLTAAEFSAYAKAEQAFINNKPAKAKKEKAQKAVKEGTRSRLDVTKHIHILKTENPRREGCPGWKSYNVYKEGLQVAAYLEHKDAGRDHLNWDLKNGYVSLK